MTAQQHHHGSRTQQQVSGTARPRRGMLPGPAKLQLPLPNWLGHKAARHSTPISLPLLWEQSLLKQHKAACSLPQLLCSRLHLALIIQCQVAEALWRHAAVEELSVLWEVGRDGDEHSQGLAERQQAVRTDLLACWFGCS